MTYMKRYKRLCGCKVNIFYNNGAEKKYPNVFNHRGLHIPYRTRCKFHKLTLDIRSSYLDYKISGDKSCYWLKMWFKYQIKGDKQ